MIRPGKLATLEDGLLDAIQCVCYVVGWSGIHSLVSDEVLDGVCRSRRMELLVW
jgi:hypothetical protein